MSRHEKVLQRVLSGLADQTVRFDELCALLARLAFVERQHGGSHRIFTRPGMTEIVNIQPRPDGTAKPLPGPADPRDHSQVRLSRRKRN